MQMRTFLAGIAGIALAAVTGVECREIAAALTFNDKRISMTHKWTCAH